MNGVPAGSDSFWSLWNVIPCTVKVGGQATGDCGLLRIPWLNSAVEVMTLNEEPGATAAVSAKSLQMARMSPVDGWMTTIELCGCAATALRAALSADELIVVPSDARFTGGRTIAWLFGTAVPAFFPAVSWISTSRPALTFAAGGAAAISCAMLVSPGAP